MDSIVAKSCRDYNQKSKARAAMNKARGEKLKIGSASCGDIVSGVYADLLILSGYEKANGELTNLKDNKGRQYSCVKPLLTANTRLDVGYDIRTATRHRKILYNAFHSYLKTIKENDWNVSFLTLTYPNLLGVGFELNDKFQTCAWTYFLDMPIFKKFLDAGYIKIETTTGNKSERRKTKRAFDLNFDGLNHHAHCVVVNKLPFATGSTFELENQLKAMNKDKRFSASKKLIRQTLKFISAWTNCLKKAHIEIFGTELKVKSKSGRVQFDCKNVSLDEIKSYDINESKNGIFWELAKASSYTAKGRGFEDLSPELLCEAENFYRNKHILSPFGSFHKSSGKSRSKTKAIAESVPADLDKATTYRNEQTTQLSLKPLFIDTLRGEKEKLKDYGIRLCSLGQRLHWENYLSSQKDFLVAQQREKLLSRFPDGIYTDNTGEKFYGWRAEQRRIREQKRLLPEYNPATDIYRKFESYQLSYDADEFKRVENKFYDDLELKKFDDYQKRLAGVDLLSVPQTI
jgi:hypothetical protein